MPEIDSMEPWANNAQRLDAWGLAWP